MRPTGASIMFAIAGACFTAVIPTVVGMMWPTIAPDRGIAIIVASATIGVAAFMVAVLMYRAAQREQQFVIEPLHIIGLGLLIAAAGVVWQFFWVPPKLFVSAEKEAVVASAPLVEAPITRYYSSSDKDRIAEVFHQLRDILNNDADTLQSEVQKMRQLWSQRESKRSDEPLDIGKTLDRLGAARSEASRLSNQVFGEILKANTSYEPLLKSVLAFEIPDPFKRLYQHADRIKGALESAQAIYQESPARSQEMATLVLRVLEPFAETNSRLNGWISDTLRRIEEQEGLILSKG